MFHLQPSRMVIRVAWTDMFHRQPSRMVIRVAWTDMFHRQPSRMVINDRNPKNDCFFSILINDKLHCVIIFD